MTEQHDEAVHDTGLRARILSAEDIPHEDVEVPEWGATVRVRGLTAVAATRFSLGLENETITLEEMVPSLLLLTLYDPATNEPIFTDGDLAALTRKSGQVLTRLFPVAQRLSGLGDLEEAKNGSGATRDGGSS